MYAVIEDVRPAIFLRIPCDASLTDSSLHVDQHVPVGLTTAVEARYRKRRWLCIGSAQSLSGHLLGMQRHVFPILTHMRIVVSYSTARCTSRLSCVTNKGSPLGMNCMLDVTWSRPWQRMSSSCTPKDRTGAVICQAQPKRGLLRSEAVVRESSEVVVAEVRGYWEAVLGQLQKIEARELARLVDTTHPVGVRKMVLPKGYKQTPVPCFIEYLKYKKRYPKFVVLIQIGTFYEAVGGDAALLVEYCHVNPMSKGSGIPRAGLPLCNLRRSLMQLVLDGQLSVAVVSEVDSALSNSSGAKARELRGLVTPAKPFFMTTHLADGDGDQEDEEVENEIRGTRPNLPVVGLFWSPGGLSMVEVNLDLYYYTRIDGLTPDALWARLSAGGVACPLYLHQSLQVDVNRDPRMARWLTSMKTMARALARGITHYQGPDPVASLLSAIKRDQGFPADRFFVQSTWSVGLRDPEPRPTFQSTASQLGIHSTPGVPSLVSHMVTRDTPSACRQWFTSLLLVPPPSSIASHIQRCCSLMMDPTLMLPALRTDLNHSRMIESVQAQRPSYGMLVAIKNMLEPVVHLSTDPQLKALFTHLLPPTLHTVRWTYSGESDVASMLARGWQDAVREIVEVVNVEDSGPHVMRGDLSEDEESEEEDEDREGRSRRLSHDELQGFKDEEVDSERSDAPPPDSSRAPPHACIDPVLRMLQVVRERSLSHVHRHLVSREMDAVDQAREAIRSVMERTWLHLRREIQGMQVTTALRDVDIPRYVYLSSTEVVALTAAKGARTKRVFKNSSLSFHSPPTRQDRPIKDHYTTGELDEALAAYEDRVNEARGAVRMHLSRLCSHLCPRLMDLTMACTMSVIATALSRHVEAAAKEGWTIPLLSTPPLGSQPSPVPTTPPGAQHQEPFTIEGMWPYWLSQGQSTTVKNNLVLDGMILLTGANMAGKSTLLRSICAVALLANVGLLVPADRARVPFMDMFILRNFSTDCPILNRSAFAVEMEEMRVVLESATEHSLVLVDELGKGTEPRGGAALAGAMVEALCRDNKSRGIFCTHIHQLLDMELNAPGLKRYCMTLRERGQTLEERGENTAGLDIPWYSPTWQVHLGDCKASMALQVALESGVDADVVRYAHYATQWLKGQSGDPTTGWLEVSKGDPRSMALRLTCEQPRMGYLAGVSAGPVSWGDKHASCELLPGPSGVSDLADFESVDMLEDQDVDTPHMPPMNMISDIVAGSTEDQPDIHLPEEGYSSSGQETRSNDRGWTVQEDLPSPSGYTAGDDVSERGGVRGTSGEKLSAASEGQEGLSATFSLSTMIQQFSPRCGGSRVPVRFSPYGNGARRRSSGLPSAGSVVVVVLRWKDNQWACGVTQELQRDILRHRRRKADPSDPFLHEVEVAFLPCDCPTVAYDVYQELETWMTGQGLPLMTRGHPRLLSFRLQ